ncbi:tyrosinase central domain protein [Aspergillus karnatakaensis]|uniref:tyrosinase family protein n=1 Tax=Aspergillus karnatakaensis TaxID=1810916 RepID=UPI003CCD7AE5
MHILFSLAALVAAVSAAPAQAPSPVGVDIAGRQAVQQCTPDQALVRKEWGSLTTTERQNYIDAIWCLRGKPSVLPNEKFPGVQDRVDDFVATHINYTMSIHKNGVLLPWHRHYIYLWETALRTECGYEGSVPYWDWTLTPDLHNNPIFTSTPTPDPTTGETTDTSLSGDGTYNATEQSLRDPTIATFPEGSGGGCVTTGPFTTWPVNMGPFAFGLAGSYAPLPENAFAYNPRCLQRNLQPAVLAAFNNITVVENMLAAADINSFLAVLDPSTSGVMGAHGGGHDTVGPTMADVFASPQDPVFMLHHGNIDRLWAVWQRSGAWESEGRVWALNGTAVLGNPAGEPLVDLETVVGFGVLDEERRLGDLMDVEGVEYCYRYE